MSKSSSDLTSDFELTLDTAGFSVTHRTNIRHPALFVHWNDIHKVTAFKRDLFAVDLICLAFALYDGTFVELDEEMPGWKELLDVLPTRLAGCETCGTWWEAVAIPAFAPNPREIYSCARPNAAQRTGGGAG